MPTTPVRLIAWLEPPLTDDVPVGASVRCRCSVLDIDSGLPVTPDVINVVVQPFGTSPAAIVPVTDATGSYHTDVVVNAAGRWRVRWLALGNPGAVGIGACATEFYAVERLM